MIRMSHVHVWRSGGNCMELFFSFHPYVVLRIEHRFPGLCGECHYPLRHFNGLCLVFWDRVSHWPEVYCLGPACPQDLVVFDSPVPGWQLHTIMTIFKNGLRVLNWGPHTCVVSSLCTEPSIQLYTISWRAMASLTDLIFFFSDLECDLPIMIFWSMIKSFFKKKLILFIPPMSLLTSVKFPV